MITARQWLGLTWITVGVFVMGAAPARAAFHLWDINEIYSNADGSVQFTERARGGRLHGSGGWPAFGRDRSGPRGNGHAIMSQMCIEN